MVALAIEARKMSGRELNSSLALCGKAVAINCIADAKAGVFWSIL